MKKIILVQILTLFCIVSGDLTNTSTMSVSLTENPAYDEYNSSLANESLIKDPSKMYHEFVMVNDQPEALPSEFSYTEDNTSPKAILLTNEANIKTTAGYVSDITVTQDISQSNPVPTSLKPQYKEDTSSKTRTTTQVPTDAMYTSVSKNNISSSPTAEIKSLFVDITRKPAKGRFHKSIFPHNFQKMLPDINKGFEKLNISLTNVTEFPKIKKTGISLLEMIENSTFFEEEFPATEPSIVGGPAHINLFVTSLVNKGNFLNMAKKNCIVASLKAYSAKYIDEECIVGFWMSGLLPSWLHPVNYEGLLQTVRRASNDQKFNFTKQLCGCRNVEVSVSCPLEVSETLMALISPCFAHDQSTTGEPEMVNNSTSTTILTSTSKKSKNKKEKSKF